MNMRVRKEHRGSVAFSLADDGWFDDELWPDEDADGDSGTGPMTGPWQMFVYTGIAWVMKIPLLQIAKTAQELRHLISHGKETSIVFVVVSVWLKPQRKRAASLETALQSRLRWTLQALRSRLQAFRSRLQRWTEARLQ